MSYHKALEVLGVSEAVVEEERARRLGELGLASWGGGASGSDCFAGQEGDDMCGGFFAKRRRSVSHDGASLGTTLPGEVAFGSAHVRNQGCGTGSRRHTSSSSDSILAVWWLGVWGTGEHTGNGDG